MMSIYRLELTLEYSGIWIWRVQDFNLTVVPKTQYGQFYQGDSYIVLKVKKKKLKIKHHLPP